MGDADRRTMTFPIALLIRAVDSALRGSGALMPTARAPVFRAGELIVALGSLGPGREHGEQPGGLRSRQSEGGLGRAPCAGERNPEAISS